MSHPIPTMEYAENPATEYINQGTYKQVECKYGKCSRCNYNGHMMIRNESKKNWTQPSYSQKPYQSANDQKFEKFN